MTRDESIRFKTTQGDLGTAYDHPNTVYKEVPGGEIWYVDSAYWSGSSDIAAISAQVSIAADKDKSSRISLLREEEIFGGYQYGIEGYDIDGKYIALYDDPDDVLTLVNIEIGEVVWEKYASRGFYTPPEIGHDYVWILGANTNDGYTEIRKYALADGTETIGMESEDYNEFALTNNKVCVIGGQNRDFLIIDPENISSEESSTGNYYSYLRNIKGGTSFFTAMYQSDSSSSVRDVVKVDEDANELATGTLDAEPDEYFIGDNENYLYARIGDTIHKLDLSDLSEVDTWTSSSPISQFKYKDDTIYVLYSQTIASLDPTFTENWSVTSAFNYNSSFYLTGSRIYVTKGSENATVIRDISNGDKVGAYSKSVRAIYHVPSMESNIEYSSNSSSNDPLYRVSEQDIALRSPSRSSVASSISGNGVVSLGEYAYGGETVAIGVDNPNGEFQITAGIRRVD